MFRISLIVCVLLTLDVTAKPWSKLQEDASWQIVVALDDSGKMLKGEEVEPPEDMDELHFDVDPRMKIFMDKQSPEEDLDDLHHPSFLPDQNEFVHPVQEQGETKQVFRKAAFEEPEQDLDEVYHKSKEQLEGFLAPMVAGRQLSFKAEGPSGVRVHLQPEEDLDDQHHKAPPGLYLPEAAVAIEYPSQRKHTEPEEDLDHLYHQ